MFIPSTLNWSCYVGGHIDELKLQENLMSAEVYIQWCNRAPCGDAEIHLYSRGGQMGAKEPIVAPPGFLVALD